MLLEGRRAIVSGGARGIGAAVVRAFAREGARVALLDVDDETGEKVAAEAGAFYRHCDVRLRDQVEEAFADAVRELGGLDILANPAGVEAAMPAEELTDEEWDRVFDIHVRGTFHTNQIAFGHLRDAGGGRIVNFGSGAGIRGQRGSAHYSAAKGAVMAWTRTVAQEWGHYGIAVNALVPSAWTEQYETHRARMTPEQLAEHDALMSQVIALGGTHGDPDRDIAPVVVFLVSDMSRFMTGQAVAVDGGMVMLG